MVHGTDSLHPCTIDGCSKSFNTRVGLANHVKTQHDGKNSYHCDEPGCGDLTFKYRRNLDSHKVRIHGHDPLVCDEW